MDDSNIGDPEIYEKNVCYVECERIYAEAVIFIDDSNEIKENVIASWLVRSYKRKFEGYMELKKQREEENLIRYEDYELYDTIKDSELKEEALIKKRILEESMNVMEESTDVEWDHDFPIDE
nr:hypothetical protein [Tanacetum cinerariifolium]